MAVPNPYHESSPEEDAASMQFFTADGKPVDTPLGADAGMTEVDDELIDMMQNPEAFNEIVEERTATGELWEG